VIGGRVIRPGVGVLAALTVATAVTAACGLVYAKREIVVHFTPQATSQQHAAARTACAHAAPNVSPEPIDHTRYPSSLVSDIRFRVDKASDADLAKLSECLRKQPGVVGMDDPMDTTR
jgi:hypothetical protein